MKNFLVLVLFLFVSQSFALYFHMGETEKKCFIEEIPDETMITGEGPHYNITPGYLSHIQLNASIGKYKIDFKNFFSTLGECA